ncbi:GNAT family N-acetyltransferase [Rhodococcus sp. IEGM 1401]|uniref:GNAT family N-acetyltransferase n=1 Tax=unclassified Rhodococcus (in: high G+C Gram-positive bacteria) TaxID=192944 RepID=UPI0022B5D776|nr:MULTISPECIES: GNAT family N-acetyltransferase [unclassified Rhodococcus (in: high G+C Gram-positive bacteria)]MCZ4560872.1 GNAT family N-acetyltransferase [Rhodococcus sp. IEGM 1401]MDI9921012.1 GNAT family N-acetyltransferase [Rhodococcus sp. IEGM 1372]MDV8033387.1 GNAT family N-acetyltransferase [Rhodococcus sp. IEGM 1414]
MPTLHHAALTGVEPHTLYRIVALRVAVFVHEQKIVDEVELDGADLLPTTELFWMQDDNGEVSATLRVLVDDTVHIGRVATAAAARGHGYAGELVEAALKAYPGVVEISAQAHLENWYGRFGFVRVGEQYLDAGIPHVRMLTRAG